MKLTTRAARRGLAAFAVTCAAILIPTAALAAPGGRAAVAQPATAAPGCAAGALTVWLGIPGDGAAGSTYYQLELSNTSGQACTLYGFPGVSAVGTGGRQLGSAASRDYADPVRLVTLRRGATAHVLLKIVDVGNFPPASCHPATAVALRVYPPNDRRSVEVPFPFQGCRKSGPVFLYVRTTVGGTGIPGFSN
jgi:Protein of unknown function (DUF4232)